jgi:MFS family permease
MGVGLAGLGDFSNTLLILWATQAWTARFGYARAATLAMAFYVGYNVVYTVSCYLSGTLADRLPKRGVLAAGYALAVIPALALLLPGASLMKFGVVFAVSGLYMGVWETVESSTAAEYLPAQVRGVGFGTLATVNGVGDLASSILVGLLWGTSPMIAMSYVVAASLVGATIIATTPVSDKWARRACSAHAEASLPACYSSGSIGARDGWSRGHRIPAGRVHRAPMGFLDDDGISGSSFRHRHSAKLPFRLRAAGAPRRLVPYPVAGDLSPLPTRSRRLKSTNASARPWREAPSHDFTADIALGHPT